MYIMYNPNNPADDFHDAPDIRIRNTESQVILSKVANQIEIRILNRIQSAKLLSIVQTLHVPLLCKGGGWQIRSIN